MLGCGLYRNNNLYLLDVLSSVIAMVISAFIRKSSFVIKWLLVLFCHEEMFVVLGAFILRFCQL